MYLEKVEENKIFIKLCEVAEVKHNDRRSSCPNFSERPTPEELEIDKLVLPETTPPPHFSAPKFTVLFNSLLGNALIISFSEWLMLEEKEMKTLCQEL